jgi:hypothetical protein
MTIFPLERITCLGDMFGRDSLQVHTVAFGPAAEDYQMLKEMANVLPRGSFSKLGLSSGYKFSNKKHSLY